jgi:hypothetical protein
MTMTGGKQTGWQCIRYADCSFIISNGVLRATGHVDTILIILY